MKKTKTLLYNEAGIFDFGGDETGADAQPVPWFYAICGFGG